MKPFVCVKDSSSVFLLFLTEIAKITLSIIYSPSFCLSASLIRTPPFPFLSCLLNQRRFHKPAPTVELHLGIQVQVIYQANPIRYQEEKLETASKSKTRVYYWLLCKHHEERLYRHERKNETRALNGKQPSVFMSHLALMHTH